MHGEGEEDYMYGFPALPGSKTVKVASERYAAPIQAERVERRVSPAESAAIHERHVAGRLRGVTTACTQASACMYTVTPDSGFIVDAMPEQDGVTFVSACSGHGFKHSAALGEQVARRLAGQPGGLDVFGLRRFEA